jgi:hypothetical protein
MIVAAAIVSLFIGFFCCLVIGFPLLLALARFRVERPWVLGLGGGLFGFAFGMTGFFRTNLFAERVMLSRDDLLFAGLCAINGALCGIAAHWVARSETTAERDGPQAARPSL